MIHKEKLDYLSQTGHYSKSLLHSKLKMLSWSHDSRFKKAQKLLEPFKGRKLLDYGCGDGTFLGRHATSFPDGTGYEIESEVVKNNLKRFAGVSAIHFLTKDELFSQENLKRYDVVSCLEVLEHCSEDTQKQILSDFGELLKVGGVVLISVPIEIGPTLLFKTFGRFLAKLRKVEGYGEPEEYTFSELIKAVFATRNTVLHRPVYSGGQIGHKGFNWRKLKKDLETRFEVTRVDFSPFPFLRGFFNSQVFFLCKVDK